MARLSHVSIVHLHPETHTIIKKARQLREDTARSRAVEHWKHAAVLAVHHARSKAHYMDRIAVSHNEHMSGVDCFNGHQARKGSIGEDDKGDNEEGDLLVIHPTVDGRLKDEGRA